MRLVVRGDSVASSQPTQWLELLIHSQDLSGVVDTFWEPAAQVASRLAPVHPRSGGIALIT